MELNVLPERENENNSLTRVKIEPTTVTCKVKRKKAASKNILINLLYRYTMYIKFLIKNQPPFTGRRDSNLCNDACNWNWTNRTIPSIWKINFGNELLYFFCIYKTYLLINMTSSLEGIKHLPFAGQARIWAKSKERSALTLDTLKLY